LKLDDEFLQGERLYTKLQLSDWRGLDHETAGVAAAVSRGARQAPPFPLLALADSPALQRKAAEIWARCKYPADGSLGPIPQRAPQDKIRLGYFSANFQEHAVAYLIAELIERHDRARFEVTG